MCGGTSKLSREETLAAYWLQESHPISNQPVGLWFQHVKGGIDQGDLPFRPRVVGVIEM